MYSHYSEIYDKTLSDSDGFRGAVGIFHGYGQCQDTFFETAIQFALNGFIVHLIDFEGFGYSGGLRVSGIAVEKMHR